MTLYKIRLLIDALEIRLCCLPSMLELNYQHYYEPFLLLLPLDSQRYHQQQM
jgi:hypothetical protein